MQEDVLLVQQALSGDKLAFCRLIQKYYKSVYAQILSLVRNPDDTEELANDVFIKAYVNLSALRQPAKFYTWLHHIARNHSRNWLRQCDNNCLPLDDVYDETKANFVCDSAEDVLIHQEKLDKIFDAIDTLSEMDKSLMQDFYLEGTPYETLQERYKISKSAINARLIRAKKRIREQLRDLFSGIMIFSWQDVLKKVLSGGVEVVKIGGKVKIITIGVVVILILGGAGVIVWHHQQSTQNITSDSSINQTIQKASLSSANKQIPANSKIISDGNVSQLSEKQNTEEDITSEQMTASGINFPKTGDSKIDPKLVKKIEVYGGLMRLLPDYKQVTQSAENVSEEMRNQLNSDFLDSKHFPEIYERHYGPDGIKVFDKQGKEITNNPEINGFVENIHKKQEEIKILAVKVKSVLQEIDDLCPREEFEGWTQETPPRRITGVVSWSPTAGDYGSIDEYSLAKWLGKELPWDGNTDYKNAKDFSP